MEYLYDDLVAGTTDVENLAEYWRVMRHTDPTQCFDAIYRLLFSCAGSQFNTSVRESLSSLTSDEGPEFHILENKDFRRRLEQFLGLSFKKVPEEILQDDTFWDEMVLILSTLIKHRAKASRVTALIFGIGLLDALTALFEEDDDSAFEDYDMDPDEVQARAIYIHKPIFLKTFHFAYRDSDAEIQEKVLLRLKHWMSIYPQTFVSSSYLRYVFWTVIPEKKRIRNLSLEISRMIFRGSYSQDDILKAVEEFAIRETPLLNTLLNSDSLEEIALSIQCLNLINSKYPNAAVEIHSQNLYSHLFHPDMKVALVTAEFTLENMRKSNSDENLALSLVRFAENILISNPVSTERSFYLTQELGEQLRVFVNSFSNICADIFDIDEIVKVIERNDVTLPFKQFSSFFLKAAIHEAIEPTAYRSNDEDNEDRGMNEQLVKEIMEKLFKSLGLLILAHQDDRVILSNFLDICKLLHWEEDMLMEEEDFLRLVKAVINTFKSSSRVDTNVKCAKALHALHQKFTKETNKAVLNAEINVVVDGYATKLSELLDTWETRYSNGSSAYYEELTLMQRKLSYLHPYFPIPVATLQCCQVFVTAFCEILSAGTARDLTIWFEVVELSAEMLCTHLKYLLDNQNMEVFNECLIVCLQKFPKCMRFQCTSNSSLFFAKIFSCSIRTLRLLHEKELFEELIDENTKKNMELSFLFFIKKNMLLPFYQNPSIENICQKLWAEFTEYVLNTHTTSFRLFFGIVKVFVESSGNLSLQQDLLTFLATLFNQKERHEYLFVYLMDFLLIIFKQSPGTSLLNDAKNAFSDLATKVNKDDDLVLAFSEFFEFGIDMYCVGNVEPEFLQFLRVFVCFLNKVSSRALYQSLLKNVNPDFITEPNFVAFLKALLRCGFREF